MHVMLVYMDLGVRNPKPCLPGGSWDLVGKAISTLIVV